MALQLVNQGKVCDIFRSDDAPGKLFFKRTNRFSIGDKVFPGEIQYKGFVLNQMSINWMGLIESNLNIMNHVSDFGTDASTLLRFGANIEDAGSIIEAEECIPIPLECIVRGYYIPESHSWDPYLVDNTLYGNVLPPGLKESEKLPKAIYTPSTKAEVGQHDENITFEQSITVVEKFLTDHPEIPIISGEKRSAKTIHTQAVEIATQLKKYSLNIYNFMHDRSYDRNIIIADTKLEFGIKLHSDVYDIVLIDEVGTPDTSRYWNRDTYVLEYPNPSMDKQYLRRYAYQTLGWKSSEEPPQLPDDVLETASQIYQDIYKKQFNIPVHELYCRIKEDWEESYEELLKKEVFPV